MVSHSVSCHLTEVTLPPLMLPGNAVVTVQQKCLVCVDVEVLKKVISREILTVVDVSV